jgi:multidrug efflux pump subunit AcrA (membrane-fusion protein)
MKSKIILFLVIPLGVAALIFGYRQMSREQAADAEAEYPFAAASHVERGPAGETRVALDTNAQQLIGLQTAVLAGATRPPEIEGYGHVLDSAKLVALAGEMDSAQTALRLSQTEYQRLKKLSAQNNASAQALETAEAKMKQDENALTTVTAQLASAASRALIGQPSDFFQSLAREQNILVRLDLPAGEWTGKVPTAARLYFPGMNPPMTATFLGRAAATDPQTQGAGFLFLVTNAPAFLRPGLAVTGDLQLPGKPWHGVIVPDDAVVRSDNRAWIYIQAGSTNFVRREIRVDQRTPAGWFATNTVSPGDRVVVTGAQMLLSEERKSQIKIED